LLKAGIDKTPLATTARVINDYGKVYRGEKKFDETTVKNIAKDLIATGITGMVWALASKEKEDGLPVLTGAAPANADERALWQRMGIKPYSIRVGDSYYEYRRLEPVSTPIGVMAEIDNALKMAKKGNPIDAVWKMMKGAGSLVLDKTYLGGVSDLLTMLSDPKNEGIKWASNFASSWMPNYIRSPLREMQPYAKEYKTMGKGSEQLKSAGQTTLQKLIPLESLSRANMVDMWGRDVDIRSFENAPLTDWAYRVLSPMSKTRVTTPTDADVMLFNAIKKLDDPADVSQIVPDPPRRSINIDGKTYRMNDKEYYDFQKAAGSYTMAFLKNYKFVDITNPKEEDIKVLKDFISKGREMARLDLERKLKEQPK
jgi:hypothetical protein